jgi:hypothetical protein
MVITNGYVQHKVLADYLVQELEQPKEMVICQETTALHKATEVCQVEEIKIIY